MKSRKFRLHFNRINMQRGDPRVWTIHLSNRCIPATRVDVMVNVSAVYRSGARQPRAWLEGYGVIIDHGDDYYCIVTPADLKGPFA